MAGISKAEREKRAAEAAAPGAEPATTVAMVRDAEQWPAPHTADVHPDEVQNYAPAGWRVQE